ncbi:hypothetical protein [Sphingomonas sp.]|uniref:hypothetical protein n=1 Tax=Sphingomonas sp. TaxID=28214 RepID=UPI001B276DFB|nr:hypothetical protein [Sphingomonas sp.]MBO9711448.1 hypothetical protein [Sphingomonas sp.]
MSVRVEGDVIHLEGACLVEDAEPLLVALQEGATRVELAAATRLHLAVAQLLIARKPIILSHPADTFLHRHVLAPSGLGR